MPKDNDSERSPSGARTPFVWEEGSDASTGGGGEKTSRVPRRRVVLIGSGVFVVLVGATCGAYALTSGQHSDTASTAALTQQSPQMPKLTGGLPTASASPSASSSTSVSKSSTPSPSAVRSTAAAAQHPASAATTARATAAGPPALPAAAGDWLLNQTTGNVAVDSAGGHDGTAQDGWWAGGTFLVNGTNSQIYTNGPVLSTGPGASFTVSAWVDMTALPASGIYDESAVSQDGGTASAFYLQYDEPTNRWAFSRAGGNVESSVVYRALSASAPALNTWTHLVGVYDAANKTQYLYVNGVAQGTATDATPFAAPGDLAIGRAQYNGQEQDWFKGAIKKVEVFGTALSSAQVAELS